MVCAATILFGISLLAHAAPLLSENEPVFEKISLTEWLEDLDYNTHTNLTYGQKDALATKARIAVAAIGTNALPWLAEMLRCEDSSLRTNFAAWAANKPWLKSRIRPSAEYFQKMGLRGAEILRPNADSLTPDLIHLATNGAPSMRAKAIETLALILPDSTNALVIRWQAMADPDYSVRQTALSTMRMGIKHCPQLSVLTNHLAGTFVQERFLAIECLHDSVSDPAILIPIYKRCLTDPFFNIRWRAVFELGNIGKAAESAVPALQKLDHDSNRVIRQAATNALQKIAGQTVPPSSSNEPTYRINAPAIPVQQMLDEYKSLTGEKLIIAPTVPVWHTMTLMTLYPINREDYRHLLEDELLAQINIRTTDMGDGTISITLASPAPATNATPPLPR